MRKIRPRKKSVFYKIKPAWIFLGLVFFVVCIFLLINLLPSPFWFPKWRVTLVLNTSPLAVVSFAPDSKEPVLVITIPNDLYVKVPNEYGYYPLGSVERLAEIEQKPDLLARTVERVLAVKITGWIKDPQPTTLSSDDKTKAVKDYLLKQASPFSKSSTNLTQIDRLLMALRLIRLGGERFQRVWLGIGSLSHDETLADGTIVKQVDLEALDRVLEGVFTDSQIRQEALIVEVRNGSQKSFAARDFARYVSTIGGKVTAINNAPAQSEACIIAVADAKRKLIAYLKEILGCTVTEQSDTGSTEAVIFVGEKW
ncbi:MAG: hypothetical protein AAB874_03665 [Patescibacteria group bacterium]